MRKTIFLTILLACIIPFSIVNPVFAAQLDARLNPNTESSPFEIFYLRTINISYPDGGKLADALVGADWHQTVSADSSNPQVRNLITSLNQKIASDGSQARVTDLDVSFDVSIRVYHDYEAINSKIKPDEQTSNYAAIDYKVKLDGDIGNYVIAKSGDRTLVDLGWRALSINDSIIIDELDINIPYSVLKHKVPDAYDILIGTDADEIFNEPLINADFILEQPIVNWHFLFDPTGINVDAGTFGLHDDISGFVVSSWTMGESSIREGIIEPVNVERTINSDQTYVIKSTQAADQANLHLIGFGALDILDGVEIAGVTPKPPEGYGTTSAGSFPVTIIYGMAGIAAVAGIVFFFISSRSLKHEKQGQQGIDPSRLVGTQTSASSGGYQTNRGEAQLRDETDYQQTRNMYESSKTPPPSTSNTSPSTIPPQTSEEPACGCMASFEMDSECDCAMQSACLCDATCNCKLQICKDHVAEMK